MSWLGRYLRSSIGAKHVVAVSGLALIAFIIAHLGANLLIFAGPDVINAYGVSIRELGSGVAVWIARGVLLAAFVVHVAMSLRLATLNAAARPVAYARFRTSRTRFYAKWMATTGLLILAFVVYHLMHFSFGVVQPESFALVDPEGRHDIYAMMVLGYQNVAVSLSYIVAMGLLAMHLAHGASSFFQSLGLEHPKYNRFFDRVGPVFAVIVFAGFTSIPVAVLAGVLTLPMA
jgi:succinate dehydrogenase / fumarate reductase, cytochrome b subunit